MTRRVNKTFNNLAFDAMLNRFAALNEIDESQTVQEDDKLSEQDIPADESSHDS